MSEKVDIHVCVFGKRCAKRGSRENLETLKRCVNELGVQDLVVIHEEDCLSLCRSGPNVFVKPAYVRYEHVCPEQCKGIVETHVKVPKGKAQSD
jgi:(2Fe-2S) ferredoxin